MNLKTLCALLVFASMTLAGVSVAQPGGGTTAEDPNNPGVVYKKNT